MAGAANGSEEQLLLLGLAASAEDGGRSTQEKWLPSMPAMPAMAAFLGEEDHMGGHLGQGRSGGETGSRSPNPPWLSAFFNDNVVSDDIAEAQSCGQFFWVSNAPLAEEAECSGVGGGGGGESGGEGGAEGGAEGGGEGGGEGGNKRENEGQESKRDVTVTGRKREREELGSTATATPTATASCSKANREKMRRDRLNERFNELSAILEPGRLPKTDKASILVDAIRVVSQLRHEAIHLKEENQQLCESIKELKAEKNELRGEKARLKMEKERLEAQTKSMVPASYLNHQATSTPSLAIPHSQKVMTPAAAPFTPGFMWQWLPPSSLDTSQDGVLRPPVA
ncbi:bHLH transcription factor [Chara braunii]|uniref:BHLH transcription factor n=1 Tax=Chara braunii TaxID=69332 RepID=A0A388LLJ2_CHABU|nr:bHLH transcription factor [Chara braunii]|eukprot:GBG83206.1 bHLH transcription factor [Chara braunii]